MREAGNDVEEVTVPAFHGFFAFSRSKASTLGVAAAATYTEADTRQHAEIGGCLAPGFIAVQRH